MLKLPKKVKFWRVKYDKGSLSSLSMSDLRGRLSEHAFSPIDDDPSAVQSEGVVSIVDVDNSLDDDGIQFGDWALFQWREDNRVADRKVVNRLLEKRIKQARKSGQKVGKSIKQEWKEEIVQRLARQSEPIPQSVSIYMHPCTDSIYYPVSSQKKLDNILGIIESVLGVPGGKFELDDFDSEKASEWLESMWADSESGKFDFSPKAVGNDENSTTSNDPEDLAFGKLNNKKCKSGSLTLGNSEIMVGLNPRQLTVALNLDGQPDGQEPEEELVMRLDAIEDVFDRIENMAKEFDGSNNIERVCRDITERVLQN